MNTFRITTFNKLNTCCFLATLVAVSALFPAFACASFLDRFKKDKPEQEVAIPFVPAFISPNPELETNAQGALENAATKTDASTVNINEADLDGEVHLDGVTPNKTIESLRQNPKPNQAAVEMLSVKGSNGTASKPGSQVSKKKEGIQKVQSELAEADLKNLWIATIDRNPIIRFALEKISLPAERHFSHSSEFMRKGLSVLVSGAAMASTLVAPTSGYQNMTVMTGSQVAQNYLSGRNKPISDLSPTEHIQLSYLIDSLKESLVEHYHGYQQSIIKLNQISAKQNENETIYVKAQGINNASEKMMMLQQYYQYRNDLLIAQQDAQKSRMQLERIAGPQAVNSLGLLLRPDASRLALNNNGESTVATKDLPRKGKVQGAAAPVESKVKAPNSVKNPSIESALPGLMGDVIH